VAAEVEALAVVLVEPMVAVLAEKFKQITPHRAWLVQPILAVEVVLVVETSLVVPNQAAMVELA
jgi:hypothetical protein